jgi:hypothetical protein
MTTFDEAYVATSAKLTMSKLGEVLRPRILKLALMGVNRVEVCDSPKACLQTRNVRWVNQEGVTIEFFGYCLNSTPFAVLSKKPLEGAKWVDSTFEESLEVLAEFMKDPRKFIADLDESINDLMAKIMLAHDKLLTELGEPPNSLMECRWIGKDYLTWGDLKSWVNSLMPSDMEDKPVQFISFEKGEPVPTPVRSIKFYGTEALLTPAS